MKHKKLILVLSVLLVIALLISGCPPFRRPAPERQPVPPAPAEPGPAPGQPAPPGQITPTPQPQPPGQPAPGAMDLAGRVAEIATNVEGVENSVAVVISNLALVGVTLDRGAAAGKGEVEIKREVARRVAEREPAIVNAYVSANPDIVRQLNEISRGVQRGEPITTFFDQITEVLRRMRAETNNQRN